MKLKDLMDMDLGASFNDPFDLINGYDKKKKKKKKKDEDSSDGVSFKDSLKEMSKSELIKMGEKMGIDFDYITTQDKKAMRKAIAKAHKNKAKSEKAKGSIKMVSEKKEKTLGLQAVKDAPPYYFDEDTRDFVIPNADVTDDMNCFNAMKSLGHIRRQKREDDGFGTMMKKLQQLIDRGMLDEAKNDITKDAIDVDYTVVEETTEPAEQKALEAKKED